MSTMGKNGRTRRASTPASKGRWARLIAAVVALAAACTSSDESRPDAAEVVAGVFRPPLQDPPPSTPLSPEEREAALVRRREEVTRAVADAVRTGVVDDLRTMWVHAFEASKQGEFETSSEADQRRREYFAALRSIDISELPRGRGPGVERGIRLRDAEPRTARLRYDMDRRELLARVARLTSPQPPIRLFAQEDATSSQYVGSNAFGVSKTIDHVEGDYFVLDLVNLAAFVPRQNRARISEIDEDWFVGLPVPTEVIRDRIERIRLLAVGTIDGPNACRREFLEGEPTFSMPKDVDYTMHSMRFRLAGFAAYDPERAEVVGVAVPSDALPSGR